MRLRWQLNRNVDLPCENWPVRSSAGACGGRWRRLPRGSPRAAVSRLSSSCGNYGKEPPHRATRRPRRGLSASRVVGADVLGGPPRARVVRQPSGGRGRRPRRARSDAPRRGGAGTSRAGPCRGPFGRPAPRRRGYIARRAVSGPVRTPRAEGGTVVGADVLGGPPRARGVRQPNAEPGGRAGRAPLPTSGPACRGPFGRPAPRVARVHRAPGRVGARSDAPRRGRRGYVVPLLIDHSEVKSHNRSASHSNVRFLCVIKLIHHIIYKENE